MKKDKHVLPDMDDTLTAEVFEESKKKDREAKQKTIYGPTNQPLETVNVVAETQE